LNGRLIKIHYFYFNFSFRINKIEFIRNEVSYNIFLYCGNKSK